jgi:hypothetical protein
LIGKKQKQGNASGSSDQRGTVIIQSKYEQGLRNTKTEHSAVTRERTGVEELERGMYIGNLQPEHITKQVSLRSCNPGPEAASTRPLIKRHIMLEED